MPSTTHSAPNQAAYRMQGEVPTAKPLTPVNLSSDFNHNHAPISSYKAGEAPRSLTSLHGFLTAVSTQLGQLNEVRVLPDPSHTPDAHVLRLNDLSNATFKRLCKDYDRAQAGIMSALAMYDSELNVAGKLAPTPHSAELRSILRGMSEADRFAAMMQAIAEQQTDTVAAFLSAPALASGVTDKQLQALRQHHLKTVAPDLLAEQRVAQAAAGKLAQAFDSLMLTEGDMSLQTRADEIRRIAAESRRHDAALSYASYGQ
jgi:hypothetical protein